MAASTCADGPPLPCKEKGCPAPLVTCEFLAAKGACEIPLDSIWEESKPLAHPQPVWMHCRQSCKQCVQRSSLTDAQLATLLDEIRDVMRAVMGFQSAADDSETTCLGILEFRRRGAAS